VDQLDQPRRERRRHADFRAELYDDAELGVHLRAPLADRQVAPDAAVSLG
jgi:hypothetical protein